MKSSGDENSCLLCENRVQTRGLCTSHYLQFTRKRKMLGEENAIEWETILIRAGKLLPNKQGQREKPNAFADDFAEFVSQNPKALRIQDPSPLQTVKEMDEKADKPFGKAKKKGSEE